ncbi:MAG: hypothetical protein C5B51_14820 [Terriglobia bacterium]|nr:MAG: hypothetical protein C5B51_14820 [Terriglobia bacterium]
MEGIGSLFGSFVVIAGLVGLMLVVIAPEWGRAIFKNVAVAIGLFFLGCLLLGAGCPGRAQIFGVDREAACGAGLKP